ncbi:hypothetical protein [Parvibaculum sp.]|uniref:serine O-acetyltransferase n=1 Tax=Parvibaculum sp. TaxID=2024848 RepID=UPI003298222F
MTSTEWTRYKQNRREQLAQLGLRIAEMPGFREAVLADMRIEAAYRGIPVGDREFSIRNIRLMMFLCWETDAFFALLLYRLRTSLRRRRVPVLPRLLDKLSMMIAQVCIGDPVIIHPGVLLPHGQVVIDGLTVIHSKVVVRPFAAIGLLEGNYQGPTIESGAMIGLGAKVLGPVTLGQNCKIGANAVVLANVGANATAVGMPARTVKQENRNSAREKPPG